MNSMWYYIIDNCTSNTIKRYLYLYVEFNSKERVGNDCVTTKPMSMELSLSMSYLHMQANIKKENNYKHECINVDQLCNINTNYVCDFDFSLNVTCDHIRLDYDQTLGAVRLMPWPVMASATILSTMQGPVVMVKGVITNTTE